MKKLALALAASGMFAFAVPALAVNSVETPEAKQTAASAASIALADMAEAFGTTTLKPGKYLWRTDVKASGEPRVIISLTDQLAFVYQGSMLVAVSTISSGKPGNDTPTGIFPILQKKPMHRSVKYENAPMPHMQRIDKYGIALHAGFNPGHPASHGCVRLPAPFAAKLYKVTDIGTPVLIGA